jgi:hypothetical protein
MKKIIQSAICSAMFLFASVAFPMASGNAGVNDEFKNHITVGENELKIALQYISVALDKDSNHLEPYEKNYCNNDFLNCEAGGVVYDATTASSMGSVLSSEQGSVIIQKIVGGWVGHPTAANQPAFDFIDLSRADHTTVFDNHLCVEVHFKDSTEISNSLPLWAGKTVVLCGLAPGGELIDIDMVDSDTSNGGDTSHKTLPVAKGSWKCFNPHNDFCNNGITGCPSGTTLGTGAADGGAGFGYDTNDDDPTDPKAPYGLDTDVIFGVCLTQATSSLLSSD